MRTYRFHKTKKYNNNTRKKYNNDDSNENSSKQIKQINQINEWKIIHLYGDAYTRGYTHGSLLHNEIKKSIRNFKFFLQETLHTTLATFVETTVGKIKPVVVRDYPEITEELKGICKGFNSRQFNSRRFNSRQFNSRRFNSRRFNSRRFNSRRFNSRRFNSRQFNKKTTQFKLTFDVLLAWNSMMSLYDDFYRKRKIIKTSSNPSSNDETAIKQRCAAFIATGEATKTGEIVMGHNTYCDFVTGYTSNIIISIFPPPGEGFPFIMQAMPGYVSSTIDWFICSTGIVGCETTISSIQYTPDFENGAPYFCRIRQAMQYAQSLDEYATIMKTQNAGDYACSWLFGDTKTNEIMVLELGLDAASVSRTKNGVYYGMNTAIDNTLRSTETSDNSIRDLRTSSGSRNARFQYLLLEKYYGKIDMAIAKRVLADHYDSYLNRDEPGKRTICSHTELSSEGQHPYYPHGAIDCKVVDTQSAKKMSFFAKWGAPCGRAFKATQFMRDHPEYSHYSEVLEDFPVGKWTKIIL